MAPNTPYSADLGAREPISAMREAATRIGTLTRGWTPAQFERTYAPGKWTVRQILVHLAQTELALGNRARMAITTPNYTSQAFDQDRWMEVEGSDGSRGSRESRGLNGGHGVSGEVALQALLGMNAMNCAFFQSLTSAQRETPFTHPEYGALTVDWLIHQMAGHLIHHQVQLEELAA